MGYLDGTVAGGKRARRGPDRMQAVQLAVAYRNFG